MCVCVGVGVGVGDGGLIILYPYHSCRNKFYEIFTEVWLFFLTVCD